jgi:hypothetical protein
MAFGVSTSAKDLAAILISVWLCPLTDHNQVFPFQHRYGLPSRKNIAPSGNSSNWTRQACHQPQFSLNSLASLPAAEIQAASDPGFMLPILGNRAMDLPMENPAIPHRHRTWADHLNATRAMNAVRQRHGKSP